MNCYARFSRRKKTILPAVCLGRNLSYLAFHSRCSFSSRSFHPIFGASRTVFFAPSSAFTARLLGRSIICVVTRWFCVVDWAFCGTSPVIVFFFYFYCTKSLFLVWDCLTFCFHADCSATDFPLKSWPAPQRQTKCLIVTVSVQTILQAARYSL